MYNQCRYSAQILQNNKIIVSYYCDDLYTVKDMISNIVEQEEMNVKAEIIDKNINKTIYSISNNDLCLINNNFVYS